jgi:hypothetical protein
MSNYNKINSYNKYENNNTIYNRPNVYQNDNKVCNKKEYKVYDSKDTNKQKQTKFMTDIFLNLFLTDYNDPLRTPYSQEARVRTLFGSRTN